MKMRRNILKLSLVMFFLFILVSTNIKVFAKEKREITQIDLSFEKKDNRYVSSVDVNQEYDKQLYYIDEVNHHIEGSYDTITIIIRARYDYQFSKDIKRYFYGEDVQLLDFDVRQSRIKIVVEYMPTEGKLKIPSNVQEKDSYISWDWVDFANYYLIEISNGNYYDYFYEDVCSVDLFKYLREGNNLVKITAYSDIKGISNSNSAKINVYKNQNNTNKPSNKPGNSNNTQFNENWIQKNGRWYYKIGGKFATGWQNIDGKNYFFDENGCMITGKCNINGRTRWFKLSGELILGWYEENGFWYYHTINGMISGYCKIDGLMYYFYENGNMALGPTTINNRNYMFRTVEKIGEVTGTVYKVGSMLINEWYQSDDGGWYYYGNGGIQQYGWIKGNDGKQYYLDPNNNGRMVTGLKSIGGKTYNFRTNGELIE